ncbi:MAG: hypothetical protein R6X27_19665, partial [Candidatus Desulfacyla sp.]
MHRWVVFAVALSLGLGFQPGPALSSETGDSPSKPFPAETPLILKTAAEAIRVQLEILDQDLAEAARRLSGVDLKSDAARNVIRRLQARSADIVIDTCTVSPQGIMLLVEPAPFRSFEGTDISSQEQVRKLLSTRKPVISHIFRTVEGVAAVDMEHPVIGSDGKFLGSVSAIFQPWVLIGKSVQDLLAGIPVEIWAMQPDGRILYDADRHEVGRILFSDPGYQPFPELLRLGRRIAAEPEGSGTYSYFKTGTRHRVRKDAWWVSITLHGMAWRLVSVHPSSAGAVTASADAVPFSKDALHALALEPGLIQALARGNQESALLWFQQAVITHTGIYNLSFIDANAVSRFGYPRDNSLSNVDLREQADAVSAVIVKAIENENELRYSGPLIEGGQAR